MASDLEKFLDESRPKLRGAQVYRQPLHIQFFGDVRPDTTMKLQKILEMVQELRIKRLTLAISSGGGGVVCGFETYNVLKGFRTAELVTHNIGMVSSAANALFLAAEPHLRFAVPISYFMLHGSSYSSKGESLSANKIRDELKQTAMFTDFIGKLVTSETQLNRKKVLDLLESETEWSFSSEEAVKLEYLTGRDQIRTYKVPKRAALILIHNEDT